ncbi:MAG TPA: MFS transporter [Candidatus Limnocylindria bacterium]|nr:MFS transporter [Candidatus Limnocylindria bacterium]
MAATTTPARTYDYKLPFVIGASAIGTVIEWYDFYLYAVLATFLAPIFFPGDPTAQVLSALATFGAGFAVRPFGAIVFGRIGDKTGRKVAFLLTVSIMGGATVLVGLLPGYAQIGILAPIILVTLRMLQGLALGGEYGGAAIYVAEHAPDHKRGLFTSYIQTTATVGLFLALAVILLFRLSLGNEVFAAWGWRIPFLLGAVLVVVALYIRLKLQETPLYTRAKEQGKTSDAPLRDSFGNRRNWRLIFLALFGMTAGQAVVWYTGQFYALQFMSGPLGVGFVDAYTVMLIAIALATPFFIFFGWLSDKIGRKPIILGGCLLAAIAYFPIFNAMKGFANPIPETDPATPATMISQDPNILGLTAMVFLMIVLVTMVYGPIAAFLVEYFPAKIRYTSLSLPYHLGNGEFGGWLPFIASFMVASAASGGIFAGLASVTPGGATFVGLWYPIVVAIMSLIIGGIWIHETKDVRIWDEVGGRDAQTPTNPRGTTTSSDDAATGGALAG